MQSELFDLGADLAVLDAHCQSDSLRISKDLVLEQERMIDCLQQELPPITYFILPGGLTSASVLHLARTVCRRAERRVVSLKKSDAINPEILQYLNRMSDLLFVLARVVNHRAGAPEINWKSPIERDKR
ncbi:TPA: cob(I)yrinic acid a,c-diamide adenosyltransferase, partial [Candidatus Poribacteria bacterium]|jgi:cob(I)alamin adenosyltransferase|nr:cob(I)yrinic acid a,c-diamide adenosyltransferase [Candidatus Poribacteria bacterium]